MSAEVRRRTEVAYTLSMREPGTHCFEVSMALSGVSRIAKHGNVTLYMPVWTPGSYVVRDFARNILSLEAAADDGRPLEVEKKTKNRWSLKAGTSDEVTVVYKVYAFVFGTGTSYLDTDHAVINGASVFLTAEGFEPCPITLRLVPHQGWKTASTGLSQSAHDPWSFAAPNYDVLVDSPIEVGNQHVHVFEALEARHEVSIFSQKPIDEASFVRDLKKIVESTVPIFGDVPYKKYVFLVDFVAEAYGGLEHTNSTLCLGSYFQLEPPEEYRLFLSLFSHEFFHTWNVKRMRPAALGPFDYSAENYTRSLWVAEGLTSYYEDVILRRAGIFSVPEFLDDITSAINFVKSLPSSRVQSPEEASFDSWVRHYKQDENSPNVSPSYYRQGTVIGLLLDLQIRGMTEEAHSLDDVMRAVYRETYLAQNRGFTDAEFQEACGKVSLGQTDEIFTRYVRGREEIDFDRYLGYAGLQLTPKAAPSPDEGFLGVRLRSGNGLTVLTRLTGSPAEAADLSSGDEIIATDGLRTDQQKLSFYIANRRPGTRVELTIARGGVLRTLPVTLGTKPVFEYRITKRQSATEAQKKTFAAWAIENWHDPLVYREHRPSPVSPKALDYV